MDISTCVLNASIGCSKISKCHAEDEEHHHHAAKPLGRNAATNTFGKDNGPQFRRFTQATDLELFHDLFFVANLTVFTYAHEVNDADSLKQYVGFFCIIWFTWYAVSLHDVRFAMDSVFERICKAVQFLVMIGFAVVGPEFNVGEENSGDGDNETLEASTAYLKGLTLVLMISRLVLVAQYVQNMYFALDYKKVKVPMTIIAGTYLAAAMIYLGLFWTFHGDQTDNHSYIAWYVIAVAEAIIVTGVSMIWRSLSFQGTHLHERMSLLTLIILGEGAIGIAKSCQYVTFSEGTFSFTGSVAAEIFCAVIDLYFLYMLYFDWIQEEEFGIIRQQLWSVLHFPLHVALVLAVEGASQCITWNAAIRRGNALIEQVEHWVPILNHTAGGNPTASDWMNAAVDLNTTANNLFDIALERSSGALSILQTLGYSGQTQVAAVPAIINGTKDGETAGNAFWWLTGVLYQTTFKIAGFYPPETTDEINRTVTYLGDSIDFTKYDEGYWMDQADENLGKSFIVFRVTFGYFFTSVGTFVILCATLAALNRGSKTRQFCARLMFMKFVGLGIALLSCMLETPEAMESYVRGPWVLPTVTLCLFAIVVLNSIKLSTPKITRKRQK
ncbi:hypothetical protein AC579_9461 [Pseudocercospora musae]|uniref:Uncharacterized protein n=1 Tax=Pseudocercospora musae TaxID=113226 RepID=A0A139I9E4_9PEZI|nr:hypothetical protein AC579_9461 [Pseudocercospora musae]